MRRIAIINQKGGVGKTTTTVNLAAALANMGRSVQAIDLDPQAHMTMHLGLEPQADAPSIYNALMESTPLDDIAVPVTDNCHVVGSHINLAAAPMELASSVGREVLLRDLLDNQQQSFDYVLMDCPPSLDVLTLNALVAANELFVCLQPHFLALQGLSKLFETVNLVARRINTQLKITGIVLCMYESGTRLAAEVCSDLQQYIQHARGQQLPWSGAQIFDTYIRRNIKLAEAPSFGVDIFRYAPDSNGAADYARLAQEVDARQQTTPETSSAAPEKADAGNITHTIPDSNCAATHTPATGDVSDQESSAAGGTGSYPYPHDNNDDHSAV